MKTNRSYNYLWHIGLFVISLLFFLIHFHKVILTPNSVLATVSGDGIHGYYSFVNHIVNNTIGFNTIGLNYPFNEHLVYTDAQPFLVTIIQLIPFLKPYAIGIMHLVLFLSFIFSANIYFKIFEKFEVNKILAFFSSVSIIILSPQIGRLGGHFALAYALPIPLCIYFSVAYYFSKKQKYIYFLSTVALIGFFTHPYLGLGIVVFSLLFFSLCEIFALSKINKQSFLCFLILILPLFIFKGIMYFTDSHFNRPTLPYGESVYVSSFKNVFLPSFGPFKSLFNITNEITDNEWEGLSYIGIFNDLMITVLIILIITNQIKINTPILVLILSALILLLFSFGFITDWLKLIGIQPLSLKQFRGLGRFAWYFYYSIPIVTIVCIDKFIKIKLKNYKPNLFYFTIGFLFLFINGIEANYYHKNIASPIFNDQNYFSKKYLTNQYTEILKIASDKKYQAILPLPYFHLGSEVYHRRLNDNAHNSMIISHLTKLPIISHLGSRTSLNETEESISLLNYYKNKTKLLNKFNSLPILIMFKGKVDKPEEENIINRANFIKTINEINFYEIDVKTLLNDSVTLPKNAQKLNVDVSKNNIFKFSTAKPPFYEWHKCKEFVKLLLLDSNRFESGKYIVTFHYHFKKFNPADISNHFIVESTDQTKSNWDFFGDIHSSQKYPNYFVYEQFVELNKHKNYIFFTNHESSEGDFYITNFCLRPDTLNYFETRNNKIIRINNYPIEN